MERGNSLNQNQCRNRLFISLNTYHRIRQGLYATYAAGRLQHMRLVDNQNAIIVDYGGKSRDRSMPGNSLIIDDSMRILHKCKTQIYSPPTV